MHTTQVDVEGTTFHCAHNGDFSGEVVISWPAAWEPTYGSPPVLLRRGDDARWQVSVPFAVMQELVGGWLQDQAVSRLERISGTEYLAEIAH